MSAGEEGQGRKNSTFFLDLGDGFDWFTDVKQTGIFVETLVALASAALLGVIRLSPESA